MHIISFDLINKKVNYLIVFYVPCSNVKPGKGDLRREEFKAKSSNKGIPCIPTIVTRQTELLFLDSMLTTFEASNIFWVICKNWLEQYAEVRRSQLMAHSGAVFPNIFWYVTPIRS